MYSVPSLKTTKVKNITSLGGAENIIGAEYKLSVTNKTLKLTIRSNHSEDIVCSLVHEQTSFAHTIKIKAPSSNTLDAAIQLQKNLENDNSVCAKIIKSALPAIINIEKLQKESMHNSESFFQDFYNSYAKYKILGSRTQIEK